MIDQKQLFGLALFFQVFILESVAMIIGLGQLISFTSDGKGQRLGLVILGKRLMSYF